MTSKGLGRTARGLALAAAALALAAPSSFAVELAAVEATANLPDGASVAMWAYVDAGADASTYVCPGSPVSWAPGPLMTAADGDTLTVNIKNCLSRPVSVFIPGQYKPTAPVTFTDLQGRTRVRSFDAETAPGAVGSYTWTNIKQGTYLYHSASHPQIAVQMGLYGALKVDSALGAGCAYSADGLSCDVPYDTDRVLLYSEIDPALHDAVATGTYGTAAYPSTFDYRPAYFLINGQAWPDTPEVAFTAGDHLLLRFVNAGIESHSPTLGGGRYMQLVADDGNLSPFPVQQYGVELPPAKTMDATIDVLAPSRTALYDRALHLRNGDIMDPANPAPHGGMLTYLNAGDSAGLFLFDAASYSVAEDGGFVTITVSRVAGSAGAATVDYATADGTATTAGLDYSAASGTLSFADGETSQSFDVTILDDSVYEGDETFDVALSNPTGGAGLDTPALATVTITDNDAGPGNLQLGAATYSVAENGGILSVTVDRVNSAVGAVTVDLATSDGTATAGSDYTAVATTVSFADGEVSQVVDIPILDDTVYEGDETFDITLSNPTGGAVLGTPVTATATILEDDPGPGALQLDAATYSVAENGGNLSVTVNRTGGAGGAVTVDLATSDGTATAGSDYTAVATTVSFADGEVSQVVDVPIVDDAAYEGDETFDITLSNPTGGAVLGTPVTATATILDNDAAPNVAPVANDDTAQVVRYLGGTPTSVTFSVVDNDVDSDGTIDPTSVVITTGSLASRGGTVVNNGDGTVTYTPKRAFQGTDTFSYTVNDNLGATSNEATARINVTRN